MHQNHLTQHQKLTHLVLAAALLEIALFSFGRNRLGVYGSPIIFFLSGLGVGIGMVCKSRLARPVVPSVKEVSERKTGLLAFAELILVVLFLLLLFLGSK